MVELMGSMKDIVSTVADSGVGVASLALVGLSLGGILPRVGLGRALSLRFRGYWKTTYPVSVRASEIKHFNEVVRRLPKERYIAVVGESGIGKTCLIDTALNRNFSVVSFSTQSGADKDRIVDKALRALTGVSYWNPEGSARRLIFFHSFLFQCPPIAVLRVYERQAGEPYASVTSAVRVLAEDYGVRVVVDGVPGSLPPELFTTYRETVIEVERMSKDQIESIPEFKDLIDCLKRHQLDDAVWKVFGGYPLNYLKLDVAFALGHVSLTDAASEKVVTLVKNHLHSILSHALSGIVVHSSANTHQIIKIFREKKLSRIPGAELKAMGFSLDYPNRVFRESHTLQGWMVEPASPALAWIITENVTDDAGVVALRDKLMQATT